MTKQDYNGWTNYETWNVKLWMDNEESSQRYWQDCARSAWEDAEEGVSAYAKFTGKEIFTREERAVLALEKQLKEEHESAAQDFLESASGGASMFHDLLNAAMSEVNWHEIAQSLVSDVTEVVS